MVACSSLSVLLPLRDEKEGMCKVTLHGKTDPCPKKIRASFDPINAGKDVIVWREGEDRRHAAVRGKPLLTPVEIT